MRIRHHEAIMKMRSEGYTFLAIAEALGLPRSTVHYHYSHNLPPHVCVHCSVEFSTKNKRKKFCSDACRITYWNSHLEQVKRKAYYRLVCQRCGEEFQSYGNDRRKYCSRQCYNEARTVR